MAATRLFRDLFTGTALNTADWFVVVNHTMSGMWSSLDFVAEMVSVSGGFLRLKVVKGAPTPGKLYSGGFVGTRRTYSGGYFEARCTLPAHSKGMCHAFWMNVPPGIKPEIDITETQGNITVHSTLHELSGESFGHDVPNPYAGRHDHGMFWEPGVAITWYIDRKETFRLTEGQVVNGKTVQIPSTAMTVMFNSAVGNFGYTDNPVDETTMFPSTLLVHAVQIWDTKPF